ncbi:MAG: undecaprenyldiphospho-muramoylpentapeptide beta-N-acetylglucosaminyltransferase [Chromatiales bacterium]|nr:undecaprenyldiphospho-muramoylpentapeptide beta-N-acetylglucosaminyltransferase [Chromatiales bacterium]
MATRVMIMAGGTGGHIFPALAVGEVLRERGVDVVWMGSPTGLEAELVPAAGYPVSWVKVSGLRGKGALAWALAPFKLAWALSQALGIVFKLRPAAVLGMGGFVTGPGGVVSWLLRRPLVLHEQNAIPGLTNRLLRPFARRVLTGFPDVFGGAARAVGNPIRKAIGATPLPDQRLAGRQGRLNLLVLGGSLGAKALNETLPKALALLPEDIRPKVRHQCGRRTEAETVEAYRSAHVEAQVSSFIEDMADAYGWADLVVCRAGALTIAELCAAGVASILVPFPHAVDDHQTANARFLEQVGAALLAPQDQLTPERLADWLREFHGDRERLLGMARAARDQAHPEAARAVADACLEVARHG